MDNIYTYIIDLPNGIKEAVMPCNDGFTIYIDAKLDHLQRIKAYKHAMEHIRSDDWCRFNVQEIEAEAHA